MAKDKNPTYLTDLEVHEVSGVDHPAIRRKFLLIKSASGSAPEKPFPGANFTAPDRDKITTSDKDKKMAKQDSMDKAADGKGADIVTAQASKAADDTSLAFEFDQDTQAALGETLTKASDRLKALAVSVQAAKTTKAFDSDKPKIPEKLLQEVVNIRAGLASVVGKSDDLDKAAAMADPEKKKKLEDGVKPKVAQEDEEEMADKKKKGEKPFSKSESFPDILAELEKADMSDGMPMEMMAMLYKEAGKEKLRNAMDSMYENDFEKAAVCAGMAYKYFSKYLNMSPSSQEVAMSEQIESMRKSLGDIEKAGKAMSSANWGDLEKGLKSLLELAEKLRPGSTSELAGVSKTASSKTIQDLVDLVRKKDEQIKSLEGGARPMTQAHNVGDTDHKTKGVSWPKDLNADYNSNSFPEDLKF